MEIFKFVETTDGYLSDGVYVNGIRESTWIERYRDPGEFTIKAPVSSNLRMELPVGTLISKVETEEVMIVEDIEIDEDVDDEAEVVITGSSLESYSKHRIVGDDIETYVFAGHRLYVTMEDYILAFDTSWEQARVLLDAHLHSVFNIANDNIAGFVAISNQQHIGTSTTQERAVKPGSVHARLIDLLAIDDFGIKTVRPNADNVDPTTTEFRIHNGSDKTASVIFSYARGDLEKPRYFWSGRAKKTDYYCFSNYIRLRSDNPLATGLARQVLAVDCTDLDSHLTDDDVADGTIMGVVGDLMDVRGQEALRRQIDRAIISTNIQKSVPYHFRKDYQVGDLVTVNGNYGESSVMRVSEYVEFQSEDGESGYPTLAALSE